MVLATAAGCATASTRRRCASFREKRWKPKATATTSTRSGVRPEHRARDAGRRSLLGARKGVVLGTGVSVSVDIGGPRILKKKTQHHRSIDSKPPKETKTN